MKKVFPIFIISLLVMMFLATVWFLYSKSQDKPVEYKTEKPFKTNIIKKTVATGSVVPRKEIAIKPRVSGIVDKIFVQPGQFVKAGELLAKVKIVPNMVNLNNAETNYSKSRIVFEDAKKELAREEKLFNEKLISEYDYNQYLVSYKKAKEDLESAETNLQLVKEGASAKTGLSSTLIKSTVSGMLLDVPVKEGSSVIESNNFNEGTTIAVIADMNEMIFLGKVDESEVGKLKEGMDLNLTIGALPEKTFKAKLEFIAPKGTSTEGTIQFEVRAALNLDKTDFIRAGYSANADIVLDRKDSVLAIHESLLQFGKDSVYVEVETKPKNFEKRLVKTGLSDGIDVEVLSGIKKDDNLKVVQNRGEEDDKTAQGPSGFGPKTGGGKGRR
ncbi:MAG: efflux RND transporter periplasmic adaptor subunit [Cytophagaceae bacterium]